MKKENNSESFVVHVTINEDKLPIPKTESYKNVLAPIHRVEDLPGSSRTTVHYISKPKHSSERQVTIDETNKVYVESEENTNKKYEVRRETSQSHKNDLEYIINDQIKEKIMLINNDVRKGKSKTSCGKINNYVISFVRILTIMYVLDILTDAILATNYLYNEDYKFFLLTIIFLIFPPFIILRTTGKSRLQFIPCLKSYVGNVFSYKKTLTLAHKSNMAEQNNEIENQIKYHEMMLHENVNANSNKFVEGIIETSPQLIIQISILLIMHMNEDENERIIYLQVTAILISMVVLTFTIVSWDWSDRLLESSSENIPMSGMMIQFIGYFGIIVSRIISIGLLASVHPVYTLCGLFTHWMIAAFFVYVTRDNSKDERKISMSVLTALTFTFIPTTFDSIYGYLILYSVFFFENGAVLIYWSISAHEFIKTSFLYIFLICSNVLFFIIGVIFTFIFFKLFYQKIIIKQVLECNESDNS